MKVIKVPNIIIIYNEKYVIVVNIINNNREIETGLFVGYLSMENEKTKNDINRNIRSEIKCSFSEPINPKRVINKKETISAAK